MTYPSAPSTFCHLAVNDEVPTCDAVSPVGRAGVDKPLRSMVTVSAPEADNDSAASYVPKPSGVNVTVTSPPPTGRDDTSMENASLPEMPAVMPPKTFVPLMRSVCETDEPLTTTKSLGVCE